MAETVMNAFDKALQASPAAAAEFAAMPPSHQREYLTWIGEAKKPETQAARIEKAIRMIEDGRTP